MPLPAHLFVSDTVGALYDTRILGWHRKPPLRAPYCRTKRKIETPADLKATLRAGAWAWPGGYPMYFVMADGEALSFKAARSELRQLLWAFKSADRHEQWRAIGVEINYEDPDLVCAHTGEKIECAYCETETG
jgi:hypothetical protein